MPRRSATGPTRWWSGCAREPLLRDVASEAQDGGLRVDIKVDREKAGRLGISMQAISDTLNDAFGQRQISTIFGQANQYRVILEAMPEYQRDPSTLSKLYLPAGTDTTQPTLSSSTSNLPVLPTTSTNLVPLSAVADGRAHHGAARHHASGAVPGRHHQLQSRAGCLARRRGRGDLGRGRPTSACRRR